MKTGKAAIAALGVFGAFACFASASLGSDDIYAAASFAQQAAKQRAVEQAKLLLPALGGEQPEWLKRFEFNWDFLTGNKPEQSILTVQPLYQSGGKQDTVFMQGSVYRYALYGDYRWTGNIGTGYRRLLANNTVLLGGNAFFDNEFSHGHRRMSIGAEAKWGPLDFGFNNYFGLSGDKTVHGDLERALGGRDLKLKTQVPYLPWAKIGAGYFFWDAHKASRDMTGSTFSADFALHPNFDLSYQWSSFDVNNNSARGENRVMLRFHLARFGAPTLDGGTFVSSKAFETRDLTGETLAKVDRENRIIVERRTTGGIIIARGN